MQLIPLNTCLSKGGAISFFPLKYVVNFCIIKVHVSYDYLFIYKGIIALLQASIVWIILRPEKNSGN